MNEPKSVASIKEELMEEATNMCATNNEATAKHFAQSNKRAREDLELNNVEGNAKKKKHQHGAESNLSNYNKKKMLRYLEEHGCTKDSLMKALENTRTSKSLALDFLNKQIAYAQNNVHYECEGLSFNNTNDWLNVFKNWQIPENTDFEAATVLNNIANYEQHPDPAELNGVDLKKIYAFLSNALLGLPQPDLTGNTSLFLTKEFQNLINKANTDESDQLARDIKNKLINQTAEEVQGERSKLSLDPLFLDDNIPTEF